MLGFLELRSHCFVDDLNQDKVFVAGYTVFVVLTSVFLELRHTQEMEIACLSSVVFVLLVFLKYSNVDSVDWTNSIGSL